MAAFTQLVTLPGSEKAAPDAAPLHPLDPGEILTVTLRLRRKKSLSAMVGTDAAVPTAITRSAYTRQYGAEPANLPM